MAREIRGWFTTSAPEIGYEVGEHWYGYLSELSETTARLILVIDDPGRCRPPWPRPGRPAGTANSRSGWTTGSGRPGSTGRCVAGGQPDQATTHLALVGAMAAQAGPENLVVETIGEARLEEWATVKLRCFGDTEAAPAATAWPARSPPTGPSSR